MLSNSEVCESFYINTKILKTFTQETSRQSMVKYVSAYFVIQSCTLNMGQYALSSNLIGFDQNIWSILM